MSPQPSIHRVHTLTFIALLVVICFSATLSASQEGPPPVAVWISEAVEQEMAAEIWVPGTVASRNDARVAAEVAGQLEWVAEVGDIVRRGQPVGRISDDSLEIQLKNDDATIRRLEANLNFVEQQVGRLEKLTREQVVSANDLEEMTSQLESAEQELVAAQVSRERTLYQISKSQVVAPFSGRVVQRLQQPGGYVAIGREIVRLVDVENIEIRAQAPLSVAPFLREGMSARVSDRENEVDGTIHTVIGVGDERSRMFEVRLSVAEPLIIGSAVRVALPSSRPRQVVAVPRDALILRADGVYVFRVGPDDTAERIEVETGVGSHSLIEVSGALVAGDRVVIRGGERLQPGQTVSISADGSRNPL